MRDPDRLDAIYGQLCAVHKKTFPDMREGQFLLNLLGWIHSKKGIDPFFVEGKDLVKYAR